MQLAQVRTAHHAQVPNGGTFATNALFARGASTSAQGTARGDPLVCGSGGRGAGPAGFVTGSQ
eukprot:12902732-Prorocentrum_lima.AAC.1